MMMTYLFVYGLLTVANLMLYNIIENSTFLKTPGVVGVLTPRYRAVNIVKSFVLLLCSVPCLYIMFDIVYFGTLPVEMTHVAGAIYASLDMSALIYNPYNHISTNVHHVAVQAMYYYCLYHNWDSNTLSKPIVVYASFSAWAYLVNGRLAIRQIKMNSLLRTVIALVALTVYSLCCLSNWSFQVYLLLNNSYDYTVVYISCLGFIIYDDLKLLRYLYTSGVVNKVYKKLA